MPRKRPSAKPAGPTRREPAGLADKLAKLSIACEGDLVLQLPLRYEDHTKLVPIASLAAGMTGRPSDAIAFLDWERAR